MLSFLLIWSGWAIFFLRIILAIILIAHGLPKLKNVSATAQWMTSAGFRPGKLWAITALIIEFFGGIFLLFGFLVQIIALLLVVQFLIIVIWRIIKHQSLIGEFEFDLLILAVALTLLFGGGGELSIDNFFGLF